MNFWRRISCKDCNNLGNTELKTLTDLNFNILANIQTTLLLRKTNQTRRIVPGNKINNEGINSRLKRVTKTALSLGPTKPKCNYVMLWLRKKWEWACPKSWKRITRSARGDVDRVSWLTRWACHFLTTVVAEAMECLFDQPKVNNQSYKATGHQTSAGELPRLVRLLLKYQRTCSLMWLL